MSLTVASFALLLLLPFVRHNANRVLGVLGLLGLDQPLRLALRALVRVADAPRPVRALLNEVNRDNFLGGCRVLVNAQFVESHRVPILQKSGFTRSAVYVIVPTSSR